MEKRGKPLFFIGYSLELGLTNHLPRDRMAWHKGIFLLIRSDTQEAEGAPLLRE